MLHGRDDEKARLAALLDGVRGGHAGTLLLHGEPGVGKSALLEDLVATAGDDVQVLRAQGVESEAPLPFAALHRLLRPVLGIIDRLPAPQARALRAAFGEVDDVAVQPFLVALATLSVLTEAAEEAPVLCVIDDAQWLDQATADAVLVASRRLGADRVAVVFAARDGEGRAFAPDDVPTMALAPLTGAAARALLTEAAAGATVSDEVADQLMTQAAGNPLALVELPTTLSGQQLTGAAPMPTQLQLTVGMERVFLDRCRRLPPDVQTLLLVAAADDSGHVATLRRAAAVLRVDPNALDGAERSGLLVVDGGSVTVRHPLVRSAVYQAATSMERREAHRALAEALDPADDPDRHAWHRAAAVDTPDEVVVAGLVAAGARAERRGGYAAASAAYQRAAELTVSEQPRAAHLYAAARNAWAAGQTTPARTLSAAARDVADDRVLRADIDRLRGRIEVNVGSGVDAHRIFATAVRSVAADDPSRALELAVAAALMSTYGSDSGTPLDVTALALATAGDTGRTRCLGHLLRCLIQASTNEWAPGLASLQEALDAGAGVDDLDLLSHLGNAALHLGDEEAHRRCFTAMVAGARDAGAGMLVLYALPRLGFTQLVTGQWTALRSAAEEALSLSVSAGQRALGAVPLGWLTLLAALQGRPATEYDPLLTDLDTAAGQPLGVLADPVHDLMRWAQGTRAAHDGDTAAALHHLASIRLSTLGRLVALDRIDAAVRVGDREQAAVWVKQLVPFAEGTQWAWAMAAVDHGRALLAAAADAPALFEAALAHHARAQLDGGERPYDRARTHLAYGEFLRRSQRRVDARAHLRAALETFDDLRAEPLAARASQELRASGETARKRDPSTQLQLTPMERQVAGLVGQGMSNKDIAAQCWVSPRTVAFHLRNIFTKAGVTSRGELAHLDLA